MARIKSIPKERAAVVLRSLYDGAERQFGSVPELFKCMAHRPELLLTFANFYRELWTGGLVDAAVKELVALRVAALNGCSYSAGLHREAAKRSGLSDAQVSALENAEGETAGDFDERQRAVLRLAEKLTRAPSSVTDEDIKGLRKWFGEAHLVELSLIIGSENLINRFTQGFGV